MLSRRVGTLFPTCSPVGLCRVHVSFGTGFLGCVTFNTTWELFLIHLGQGFIFRPEVVVCSGSAVLETPGAMQERGMWCCDQTKVGYLHPKP